MSAGFQISEILGGECFAIWGTDNLGHLEEGGVMLRVTQEQIKVRTEEYGIAAVKKFDGGIEVIAAMVLKQFDNLQLNTALPAQSESGTGATVTAWHAGATAGTDLSGANYAKTLRLHPLTVADVNDSSQDFHIYKAVCKAGPFEIPLTNQGARLIAVTFEGMIDASLANKRRLFRWKTDA